MWTVYQATNKVNGKRYIGVTGLGLPTRKKRHLYTASHGHKGCPRFHAAIRKYGPKSFKWQILATFSLKVMAYHHEMVLVDTIEPEYNVHRGGQSGPNEPHNKKPVICLNDGLVYESATAAARKYGLDNSEVSKACKGTGISPKWMYFRYFDKALTDKERVSLIEADKATRFNRMRRGGQRVGNILKVGPRKGKEVICIEDGKVFDSASGAARHYDVNRSSLIEMCQGKKRWPVGGHYFAYITNVGQRWVA